MVKYVGIFYKPRILPIKCLLNIYFALFIHSDSLYAIEVYGTAIASRMGKLVELNSKIMRILQFKENRSRVGELYKSFGIPPVYEYYGL
jgi:hypothetical protein